MNIDCGEVDSPVPPAMPEVVAEADTTEDEMVNVIYDFIGPSNYPGNNHVKVEDDAAMGPIMSAQYYDQLFSEVEAELNPMCTNF